MLEGKIVTMAETERQYREICLSNDVKEEDMISRKSLKALIEDELFHMDVVFNDAISKNQSQRISLQFVSNVLLSQAEGSSGINSDMKVLYDAAKLIRKTILTKEKWKFTGSVGEMEINKTIPNEVLTFFKWCIGGRTKLQSLQTESEHINQKAVAMSQSLMYECLTERQVSYGGSLITKHKHSRDLPLQTAVGLTIHSKTRSKFLVQLMHGLGSLIDYNKVLWLETAIANKVLRCMEENRGLYIPPSLVKGRFIFCAADNLDFLEDTPDGRRCV